MAVVSPPPFNLPTRKRYTIGYKLTFPKTQTRNVFRLTTVCEKIQLFKAQQTSFGMNSVPFIDNLHITT